MNAILNITVRVNAQQAQAMLRQQEAQLRGLQAAAGGAGTAMGGMGIGAALGNLNKFGKNLQWTGRQLEYNFTLPLVLAGAASTKWALENEAAMTKVRKVYGDLTMSQKQVREETNALETSFRLLSDRFGVHQDEVIEIGALWAQAGASGVALARATKLTLEAMIIGDLGAEEAVTSLIALQAAYKFSTIELKDAMAQLNIVENQTAIGFDGLMDVVTRAAGTARSAGIDIRHLAAMAAALVPTTGSASQAGNALRTMISRLMVPTKEASEVMAKMGIDIYDAGWQAKNGTQRFEAMAVGFNKLTQSQKGVVSAFVASRWQVNRFDILMADITSKTGNYAKALDATNKANKDAAGQVQYLATYTRELNTYLTSTPQRFKILTTQIQNAMASAIMPLLPAMVALLTRVAQAAKWFANLSPEIQQMALGFLLILALIGPVVKLFGALVTLFATLGEAITWLGTLFLWLADGLVFLIRLPVLAVWNSLTFVLAAIGDLIIASFSLMMSAAGGFTAFMQGLPAMIAGSWAIIPVLLVAAVAVLAWLFPEFFGKLVDAVTAQLSKLPGSVIAVFRQVVEIVKRAALAVYEWLSYINPFARHSPSLVEQVNAGVETILRKYSELNDIEGNLRGAIGAHRAFLRAVGAISSSLNALELAGKRADVVAVAPGAGGAFDAVVASIKTLYNDLQRVGNAVAKQEVVTTRWEAALDRANDKVDEASAVLDKLEAHADSLKQSLDGARAVLNELADTPIQGMGAMSDAIFENEMAQKRLRLEMMQIEDAVGPIDQLRDRMSKLQGEIEGVRATQAELRNAGAGSDVLATYDEQIAALEAQQVAIENQAAPLNELQQQLEELQRIGERLDLENSIQFDPLTRQIEAITNAVEEVPFDQLLAQITAQQAEVDRLEDAWNLADAAVRKQKAAVDVLKAARDAVAATYDKEKDKLDALKDAYSGIEGQIRDMEQAINDFASAASSAMQKAKEAAGGSDAEKLFDAAGAGDFAVPGGDSGIGREGGLADIEAWNKEMEAELEKSMQGLGKIDMFKPLKDMWNRTWEWLKANTPQKVQDFVIKMKSNLSATLTAAGIGALIGGLILGPFGAILGAGLGAVFANMFDAKQVEDGVNTVKNTLNEFSTWLKTGPVGQGIQAISNFFGVLWRAVEPILSTLWTNFKELGKSIGDELKNWTPLFDDFIRAVGRIAIAIGAIVTVIWTVLSPVLKNVIRPIFDAIIGVIVGAMEVIRGVVQMVLGVINGDWRSVWAGLKVALGGIWHAIYGVLKGAIGVVLGIIGGLASGIWKVVKYLWSLLPAGFRNIFTTIGQVVMVGVNFVIGVLKWIWNAWQFVWGGINALWNTVGRPLFDAVVAVFTFLWNTAVTIFNAIAAVISWFWTNIVQPVFTAVVGFIRDYVIPTIQWFMAVTKTVFQIVAAIVIIAIDIVIAILALLWLFLKNVVFPIFQKLWEKVKVVFDAIVAAISFAWNTYIKPIFTAIRDWIANTLVPKFQSFMDKVKVVWDAVKSAISTAWDKIKPIWQAVKDFLSTTLGGAFDSFKKKVSDIWDGIQSKTDTVFTKIKDIIKGAINGGIGAINTLINGLNKVSDILPGIDFHVDLIPRLAEGGRIGASETRVGGGFSTSRPRAIVGEGSPIHPEFVIPTDPRYRDRAFGLFAQLGSKLGVFAQTIGRKQVQYGPTAEGAPHMAIGGIIPTPGDVVNAVKGSAEWAADKVREGAAMAAFAPFNLLADEAIKLIPWKYVRDASKGVKDDVYDWVKGTDDGLKTALAELAASLVGSLKANPGVTLKGVDPKLLSSYSKYNAELGNPFTIISGKRSLAQQEALYQAYLNGTGNLAAKPNPNAPHVRGAALDHAPGTNFLPKYLDVAKKYGMHYPVRSPQAEDWHIQLMQAGGLLPRLDASLENGGSIVGARPGGAILRVGEGGYDERIQVTPVRKDEDGEGKTVNHFHGNLVFPNVTNGEDAEDFIKSLESLGS